MNAGDAGPAARGVMAGVPVGEGAGWIGKAAFSAQEVEAFLI